MTNSDPLPHVYETVVHMLVTAAQDHPDQVAITCGDVHLTYREYLNSVEKLAHKLLELGSKGERIALIMENSIDMAIAMFSVHAGGAQVVPINPLYTAREATYILKDSMPVVTIYHRSMGELVETLPHTGTKVVSDGTTFLKRSTNTDREPRTIIPIADDLATLQYTGGTTGYPKGVNLSHAQVSINISQREAILPTKIQSETIVCVMPLFHVFAVSMCLHLACYCRSRLVILPRYHPKELCDALQREKITILPAGPTIFAGLLNFEEFEEADLEHLSKCYSGSAPLPEETLRQWQSITGCFILEGYGQTEAGPVLTYNPETGKKKSGSVGVPLHGTEVEIVDIADHTKILPPGKTGEIRARGSQIMSGYRNLPEETASTIRDGWLYTGDIGEFDEDGYLYIRDRKKDMAIVGGYNVFPREIDEVLYTHPMVAEAATIGIPDTYYGEVTKAWVVLKPGMTCSEQDLITFCSNNLAKYKVPTAIVITTALPKTTIGKIDKKALRT